MPKAQFVFSTPFLLQSVNHEHICFPHAQSQEISVQPLVNPTGIRALRSVFVQMLSLQFMLPLHYNHGSVGFPLTCVSVFLSVYFSPPGLESVVKALLWSKMAAPPLPRLPPLPHDLRDDNDSPPSFAAC